MRRPLPDRFYSKRELPAIQAADLFAPLNRAAKRTRELLRERRLHWRTGTDDWLFWFHVELVTLSAWKTYRAIWLLVSNDRKTNDGRPDQYPAQAIVLTRSLFEALSVLLALMENRHTRPLMLARDGAKESIKLLKRLSARHRSSAKWKPYLAAERARIASAIGEWGITAAELRDIREVGSWPQPGGLFNNVDPPVAHSDEHGQEWLSGTRLTAFVDMYRVAYGNDSRVAHQKDAALSIALQLDSVRGTAFELEYMEELRNDPMLRSYLYLACMLTEIDAEATWLGPRADLCAAWQMIAKGYDPARRVYRRRYRGLLS